MNSEYYFGNLTLNGVPNLDKVKVDIFEFTGVLLDRESKNMLTYLKLLLESHLYLVGIIAAIYIIERWKGKFILVRWFRYKKDMKSAIGSADREALLYFLFNLGFAIYKTYITHVTPEKFSIFKWILIIVPLSILFRKLYFKYQGIDQTKKDYEFL